MQNGVIDKYDVAKVILFGACSNKIPKVGSRIEEYSTSDLIWAEKLLPIKGFKNRLPLWVLSGSGYGDGYGSGDGSGSGSGSGYGYGYGSGDGSGSGYGSGDGSGYGYGSGSGSGSGDGSSDGSGSGYGSGYKQLPSLLN